PWRGPLVGEGAASTRGAPRRAGRWSASPTPVGRRASLWVIVTPMRRPLIAGNWKMHKLPSEAAAWTRELLAGLEALEPLPCDVALMVPYTHLPGMARLTFGTAVALGAQDVSAHEEGAYTGEVSAAMVA